MGEESSRGEEGVKREGGEDGGKEKGSGMVRRRDKVRWSSSSSIM